MSKAKYVFACTLLIPLLDVAIPAQAQERKQPQTQGQATPRQDQAEAAKRTIGGDPRFRIGLGYRLYPYDYDHGDYNYYHYPYAYNGSYVDNGSCYVVQRRARHAQLAHASGSGVAHR